MLYSQETLLKEAFGAFGKRFLLVYVPEGEEIAGSGARLTKDCYRVVWMFDGKRHGREFSNLAAAQAYFDAYTKPIEEIPAQNT